MQTSGKQSDSLLENKNHQTPDSGGGLPIIEYWAKHTLVPEVPKLWHTLLHKRATIQADAGKLEHVELICGSIRPGTALIFYPEASVIFTAKIEQRSGTPAFKRVPAIIYAQVD